MVASFKYNLVTLSLCFNYEEFVTGFMSIAKLSHSGFCKLRLPS